MNLVTLGDLRRGDVFVYKSSTQSAFSDRVYLMLNPGPSVTGQCLRITDGRLTYFRSENTSKFHVIDYINIEELSLDDEDKK